MNTIRSILRRLLETQAPESLLVLGISLILFLGSSCITRGKIEAAIWMNNGLPDDVCEREPVLKQHGFYRKLNNGKYDFRSFCHPEAVRWLSMHETDFNKLLDEALPKPE